MITLEKVEELYNLLTSRFLKTKVTTEDMEYFYKDIIFNKCLNIDPISNRAISIINKKEYVTFEEITSLLLVTKIILLKDIFVINNDFSIFNSCMRYNDYVKWLLYNLLYYNNNYNKEFTEMRTYLNMLLLSIRKRVSIS